MNEITVGGGGTGKGDPEQAPPEAVHIACTSARKKSLCHIESSFVLEVVNTPSPASWEIIVETTYQPQMLGLNGRA